MLPPVFKQLSTMRAHLGESPLWHPVEKVLYWVDLPGKKLHRLDIQTMHEQTWSMPAEITCVAPNASGGVVAALGTGIALLNPISNKIEYQALLPEAVREITRFNDGHCDRQGRLWVGSIDLNEKKPLGGIFRFDQSHMLQQFSGDYICSNGVITDVDSRYMYICDSIKRVIYRYDFDATAGAIHNPVIFAKIPEDAGYPDGLTIDAEGFIWNAHYNGWRITRYSPDGKIDCVIKTPFYAPTSICFGGEDLKTLFITSSIRELTSLNQLSEQSLAGYLLSMETDIQGVLEPMFGSKP